MQIMHPDNHATTDGEVLVAVSISEWQCGQIMCVDCDPSGTTVVTIAVGAATWKRKLNVRSLCKIIIINIISVEKE